MSIKVIIIEEQAITRIGLVALIEREKENEHESLHSREAYDRRNNGEEPFDEHLQAVL